MVYVKFICSLVIGMAFLSVEGAPNCGAVYSKCNSDLWDVHENCVKTGARATCDAEYTEKSSQCYTRFLNCQYEERKKRST